MKKMFIFLVFGMLLSNVDTSTAQNVAGVPLTTKYRRSSLHTMLIDNDNFPKRDTVIHAYNNAPFPDKYNDHNIGIKTLTFQDYNITDEERAAFGMHSKSKIGSLFAKEDTADVKNKELPILISKYFKRNKVANKLVAKWFNRNEDGAFSTNLLAERGSYDASSMEASIAKSSALGSASLADAGEELIGNTFVVCSKLSFVSNEIAARVIRATAYAVAEQKLSGFPLLIAKKAADIVYNKASEGYSVWTHSYLFKLQWNDSIASIFYNNYYFDKNSIDKVKKENFDNTDLFKMEYIGYQKSRSLVTFSFKKGEGHRTEEQMITLATVRNVDNVFSKLQREYDIFMPKVPLFTGSPITAKIGMKEGLEGGEKFEVLEQTMDPKSGLTKYKRVGEIKVSKKQIWDNRFQMDQADAAGEKSDKVLDRTFFDGSDDKFFAGMLIKQVK